jgi:hypothetical protein
VPYELNFKRREEQDAHIERPVTTRLIMEGLKAAKLEITEEGDLEDFLGVQIERKIRMEQSI